MKLIIAIIQPNRLEAVKAALTDVEVFRLTVMDCQGFGRQKGQRETYRGAEYTIDFIPKLKIEVAVSAEDAPTVLETIISAANTGNIGDGKIFVSTLDDAIRIRTQERGKDAL